MAKGGTAEKEKTALGGNGKKTGKTDKGNGEMFPDTKKRNPNCSPVQLKMFDGWEVDTSSYSIKGSKLEIHDFDGPIKLEKTFSATVVMKCAEIKASRDDDGNLVRKHALEIQSVKSMEI